MKKTVSSLCITASDFSESMQVGLIALGVVDPSLSSLELFTSSSLQYPAIQNIQNENENENENDRFHSSTLSVSQNNRNTPISVSVKKSSEENNTVLSSSNKVGSQNAMALGYDQSNSTSSSASNNASAARNYRPTGGFEGVKQGR